MKVKFWNKYVRAKFWVIFSVISGLLSFILLFNIVPDKYTNYLRCFGGIIIIILIIIYFIIWTTANKLTDINIEVDGSNVNIKCGNIFSEEGFKTIPFNEYFDTIVDDKIISNSSLNGIFINKYFKENINELDDFIINTAEDFDIINHNCKRLQGGKTTKFKLSTVFVYNEFIITAFSKFDDHNRATITMPEYIEFLINFGIGSIVFMLKKMYLYQFLAQESRG